MGIRTNPWAHGPAEIYRHALEHFQGNGDTDRRLALIGFDNSIEVAIDSFLGLHPRLRGGVEIKRETVQAANQNFHTKIVFLEAHLNDSGLAAEVDVNSIYWYHQLRNQLYHSGNGMTPELHVVEGARDAARSVFAALFGFDPSPTEHKISSVPLSPVDITPDPFLMLFPLFSMFEERLGRRVPKARSRGLSAMWAALRRGEPAASEWDEKVNHIMVIRNLLAHGDARVEKADATRAVFDLTALIDWLDDGQEPERGKTEGRSRADQP